MAIRLIDWGQLCPENSGAGAEGLSSSSANTSVQRRAPSALPRLPAASTHVVGLALLADLAAESNGRALALDGLALGVDVGDGDLDRRVVLGRDEAVWG